MYREQFKRIIEASQTESLTFFVGAGVSKLSDAPKWSELIDAFSKELGRAKKSYYSNEEYLSIPQMYYYSIEQDEGKYYDFINNCFALLSKNLPTREYILKFLEIRVCPSFNSLYSFALTSASVR